MSTNKNASQLGEAGRVERVCRLWRCVYNQAENFFDSSSMIQVSPDFRPGIYSRCAAFRSVERSMPCSTLSSLMVFMLLQIVSFIDPVRRLRVGQMINCIIQQTRKSAPEQCSCLLIISDASPRPFKVTRTNFLRPFNLLRATSQGRMLIAPNIFNLPCNFFNSCLCHVLVFSFLFSSYRLGTFLLYSAIAENSRGFPINTLYPEKLISGGEGL
jgi:hypothetical protein